MYRERTSTVKVAGRFAHIFLKDMSRRASWPSSARSMYGTRDAAYMWRDTWSEVFLDGSMKVGTACSSFFCSHDGDLKGSCHGLLCSGTTEAVANLWKVHDKRIDVKQTVKDALETMKLVGAKGVDSPRVRRNEQHRSRIPRNSHQRSRLCTAGL